MSTRRSVEVPGIRHENPIPNASRIGRFVASGGIFGKDPARNGQFAQSPEDQAALMFANLRRTIEAAGGAPADILKLDVWVKDARFRPLLNPHWLALFPDERSRPARHTFVDPDLQGAALMQCAFLAVLPPE